MADLTVSNQPSDLERIIAEGDLSLLTPSQRVEYYHRRCESMGVDAMARPFDYLKLNGKLILYANKTCTDLLRKTHGISIAITGRETQGDVYIVTARATMPDGRHDESTGVVPIGGLKGEALSNAYLKCETKAKRRVTLSVVGLGMLDETEVVTIPSAKSVSVTEDGEIVSNEPSAEDVATALLEYNEKLNASTTVEHLMALYSEASKDVRIPKKSLELIKKSCASKKKEVGS